MKEIKVHQNEFIFLFVQIISNDLDTDISAMALHVDSGLGVFDAFIASLSMILVSEVCAVTFPYLYNCNFCIVIS